MGYPFVFLIAAFWALGSEPEHKLFWILWIRIRNTKTIDPQPYLTSGYFSFKVFATPERRMGYSFTCEELQTCDSIKSGSSTLNFHKNAYQYKGPVIFFKFHNFDVVRRKILEGWWNLRQI